MVNLLDKALDELVNSIISLPEYKRCVEIKLQMQNNEELISLNLDKVVEDALIYRDGTGGKLINLIIAYEEANWERVDLYSKQLSIDKNKLFDVYFKSINIVADIWKQLTEHGRVIDNDSNNV